MRQCFNQLSHATRAKNDILKNNIFFPPIILSRENTSWKKELGIINFTNGVEQNFLLFKKIFSPTFSFGTFHVRKCCKNSITRNTRIPTMQIYYLSVSLSPPSVFLFLFWLNHLRITCRHERITSLLNTSRQFPKNKGILL